MWLRAYDTTRRTSASSLASVASSSLRPSSLAPLRRACRDVPPLCRFDTCSESSCSASGLRERAILRKCHRTCWSTFVVYRSNWTVALARRVHVLHWDVKASRSVSHPLGSPSRLSLLSVAQRQYAIETVTAPCGAQRCVAHAGLAAARSRVEARATGSGAARIEVHSATVNKLCSTLTSKTATGAVAY